MNLKKIVIYGGALYLALHVFRSQAKAAEPQQRLTAFQASRL